MRAKRKEIEGIDYMVLGTTIERAGFRIVRQSWTTTAGQVVFENGKYKHPERADAGKVKPANKEDGK